MAIFATHLSIFFPFLMPAGKVLVCLVENVKDYIERKKAAIVSSPHPLQLHVYSKERRISGLHEILICDIFQDVGIDTSGESRNGSNRLVKVSSNAFLPVVVPNM
uniref:Uncharacterized protein n=1 Tax=Micrurus lemniscatus lemniscatus TaxID=129467 RepID=A0A2D4IHH4_MICLE